MMRLVARKLAHGALVLIGVSLGSFLLMELVPGSYFDAARTDPRLSPKTIEEMRRNAGLHAPLVTRYGLWLRSVIAGEGGHSIVYQTPAAQLILPRAAKTMELSAVALAITWVCSLALGIGSTMGSRKWIGLAADTVTGALAAIPELVLACWLMLAAMSAGLAAGNDLAIAATVLGLSGIPALLPQIRAGLKQVAMAPYLEIARVHGVRGWRFLWIFWMRAALNPLISMLGLSVGTLLSSSLAVEILCGWPGLGSLFLTSIEARDGDVVIGVVMMSTLLLVSANTLSDLLLVAADPRIRRTG